MYKQLLEQLQKWHDEKKFEKIIETILEISTANRDYELTCQLARAYNNVDDFDKAIELLLSVKEQGANDHRWYFRLGYAYYYSDVYDDELALQLFEKCRELELKSDDIHPDTEFLIGQIKEYLSIRDRPYDYEMNDEKYYAPYWELHLEKANVPENKNDFFDNDLSPAFSLDISNTTKGLCYECELMLTEDENEEFIKLNDRLAQKGFNVDGHGWEAYLRDFIAEHTPDVLKSVEIESDTESCAMCVYDRTEYHALLSAISTAIRNLYTFTPPKELPVIEYLGDMYSDSYYPDFLVDKVKSQLETVVGFLMAGTRTYEEIQQKFDTVTLAVNDLQEEFDEHDSEIETVARDSIGMTVESILEKFDIDIDTETAIRNRDW